MPSTATPPDSQRHERVMVFIDGSNLYHVLGDVCGRHDLNFGKFAEKIAGDRRLVRTYYYNIRQSSGLDAGASAEQDKFLQTLRDTPYMEIRMGVSKRHGDSMVEKGVDVFMATDMVAFAFMDLYDTAIVVSGDGDFFPAIQTAKNQGKHVEVAAFNNNLSAEAANVADVTVALNKTYFTGLWADRRRRSSTTTTTARSTSRGTTEPQAESKDEKPATRGRSAAGRGRSGGSSTSSRRGGRRRATAPAAPREASPAAVAVPEPPEPAPEPAPEEPQRPTRRTVVRRRVGGFDRSGNSGGNGTGDNGRSGDAPRPPALRRRSGDDAEAGGEAGGGGS